jgi:hypothetical protein
MAVICIYPLPQFFHLFHQQTQNYIHLFLRFLRNQNDKGKEYKTLFQIFVRQQIVKHDKNCPARIQIVGLAVRLETICRQAKADTPGVPCKFWIKRSRASQASLSAGCDIISKSSLSCFPFLCHLICFTISSDRYIRYRPCAPSRTTCSYFCT